MRSVFFPVRALAAFALVSWLSRRNSPALPPLLAVSSASSSSPSAAGLPSAASFSTAAAGDAPSLLWSSSAPLSSLSAPKFFLYAAPLSSRSYRSSPAGSAARPSPLARSAALLDVLSATSSLFPLSHYALD